MHFAFILRHRRRLLMQFDPSKGTPLSSPTSVSLKRSFAQPATANARKMPRFDKTETPITSSPSSSRAASRGTSVFSPEFQMPTPSTSSSYLSSNSRLKNGSPVHRATRAAPPVFRGGKSKSGVPFRAHVFDGPMHDMDYIVTQFNQQYPHTSPLKQVHELNPKSALANFETTAFGTMPKYEAVEGLMKGKRLWRYVIYCHYSVS